VAGRRGQSLDELIVGMDEPGALAALQSRLDAGEDPTALLAECRRGMERVGKLYEEGKYFISALILAGEIFEEAAELLVPLLQVRRAGSAPCKMVIATVRGDIHDIGKNMVAMMWEGAGFEVVDLGVNVPPQKFVDAVQNGARLVGISALLTTTMTNIPMTIQALQDAGLREQVKIMIGGAPITAEFAQQIGADGYAADANKAVSVAKQLLGLA